MTVLKYINIEFRLRYQLYDSILLELCWNKKEVYK